MQDEPKPTEMPACAVTKGERDHHLPNSDSSTTSSTCSSRGTDIILEAYKYLEVNDSTDANAAGGPNRSDINSTPDSPTTADNSTGNHSWDMQDNSGRTIDDDVESTPSIPPPDALTRLLSSCSVASESGAFASCCPICLDPMTPMDHEHPLQCPSRPHCHYNFCVSCINSLLSSSKDDFEMASDGNSHVKVYLHCPNCRADLSSSIRDVLLLRKVDTVEGLLQQQQQQHQRHETTTSLLNASQERTRLAMEELHVQEAVQRARAKEKEFWKAHRSNDADASAPTTLLRRTSSASTTAMGRHRSSSSWKMKGNHIYEEGGGEDEWGVEADLVNGVHSSFRMPADQKLSFLSSPKSKPGIHSNHHHYDESKQAESKSARATACTTGSSIQYNVIDETLFHGLEACMTHAEQLKVSHLHTTGKPNDLARAAHILQEVEQDARQGIKPSHRQQMMNRRASVYGIIEETRQIDISNSAPSSSSSLQAGKNNAPQIAQTSVQYVNQQQQHRLKLAAERRQLEMSLMLAASLLERCPLPVRMPRSITLDIADPSSRFFPLRFCADTWDGTVLDAYTRLNISAASSRGGDKWKITKKAQTQHPGVFHVLSQGKYQNHYGHVTMLENANTERILVASVQGLAGRQGVMKGDVVTHLDGDELKAGTTVHDLIEMLKSKKKTGQKTFDLVLNADVSIAEALKRRAQVMQ